MDRSNARSLQVFVCVGMALCLLALFPLIYPTQGSAQKVVLPSAAASVVVGAEPGSPEQELYRVVGGRLVADTAILVASRGSDDVRLYSMSGQLMRTFGRRGGGPEEHQMISKIFLRGDTVLVFDGALLRLGYWHLSGEFLSSIRLAPVVGGDFRVHGIFEDGSLLAVSTPRGDRSRAGMVPAYVSLLRVSPLNEEVKVLGRYFWHMELVSVSSDSEGVAARTTYPAPIWGIAALGTAGIRFWRSDGRFAQVVRHAETGAVQDTIRLPLSPVPLTAADRRIYIDQWVSSVPDRYKPRLRDASSEITFPEHFPFITDMVVSSTGDLWLGPYIKPGEAHREWLVYSDLGGLLFRIRLPGDFELLDAAPGIALGLVRGQFDEEQIAVIKFAR